MKRLHEQTELNSPEAYDDIFKERARIGVDKQDMRRWKKLISKFTGGKIIDIGALDSRVFNFIKHNDYKYLGIDVAEKSMDMMNLTYGNSHIRFEVRDCYDTKLPDEFFDYAIMGELIEHLDDPIKAIQEALRILKKGGTLAISTPHNEAQEKGAVDGHRHLWSFTYQSLTEILKPYGRVTHTILGSEYFPIYKYHFPTLIIYCKKK